MKNKILRLLSDRPAPIPLPYTELFPAYFMKLLAIWFIAPFDAMVPTSAFFLFLRRGAPEYAWGLILLVITEIQIVAVARGRLGPRRWAATAAAFAMAWFTVIAISENWKTVLVPTFAMATYFQLRSIILIRRKMGEDDPKPAKKRLREPPPVSAAALFRIR